MVHLYKNAFSVLALTALPFCNALQADIVINEVRSTGDYDYIELYNNGANNVTFNANEWVVKDNKDDDIFPIPAGTTIDAGDFVLILTGETTLPAGAPADALIATTDADFGIGKGDSARLYHNGVLMDSHTITDGEHADTEGRFPDGSDTWKTDLIATPKTSNQSAGSVVADPSDIVINEVRSKGDYDYIELYNKGLIDYTFTENTWFVKDNDDGHTLTIPADTVIAAGEFLLILTDNETLPEGVPSSAILANSGNDFGLGKGDTARLFHNTDLIDSHEITSGSHANTEGRLPDGGSWATSNLDPTPGLYNKSAPSSTIVINEVRSTGEYDYIELYNTDSSDFTFAAGEWVIKDSDDDHVVTVSGGTIIPANGFLLVLPGKSVLPANLPTESVLAATGEDFGLGKGDTARLFHNNTLVDSFTTPSGIHADTLGRFGDGGAWSALAQSATPANTNAYAAISADPSDLVINEVRSTGDFDYVEIYNSGDASYTFLTDEWVLKDSDDTHSFTIPAGTRIEAKGFLTLLPDDATVPTGAPAQSVANTADTFGIGKGDSARLYYKTSLIDAYTIAVGVHAQSDGRFPDGGAWSTTTLVPSPGMKNTPMPAMGTLSATILDFSAFNSQEETLESAGMRVFGPNASLAQDVEPEYIAISEDASTAWVSLQENNAIAKITLGNTPSISQIFPLGYKDHGLTANAIDTNDKDGVMELKTYDNLFGMYQPDGIATFEDNGVSYVISANEGDVRDWFSNFDESSRVEDIDLDDAVFPNEATLKTESEMGRLTITKNVTSSVTESPLDEIYVFGARSFSIWNGATGAQVFDSGSDIAQNANAAGIHPDKRSDNKGNEPESVVVGMVGESRLAFVALERSDAIIIYDITNPSAASFLQILTHTGDEAPEGVLFIEAAQSPTSKALLVVSNEDSGTVTVYENSTGTSFTHLNTLVLEGGKAAAEISDYDPVTQKLFTINNATGLNDGQGGSRIDIIDFSTPSSMNLLTSIDVTPYGNSINSISIHSGLVAGALEGFDRQGNGSVVMFNTLDYALQAWVEVGAQPDMVKFSPNGKFVLTADEGEPSEDYSNDPLGSVSIITMPESYLDSDGDHIPDTQDNAPEIANTDQADSDGDGSADVIEQGANHDDPTYDGNHDGHPDYTQAKVKTLHVNGTSITVKAQNNFNGSSDKVNEISDPSGGNLPAGVTFPMGILNIDVTPDETGHAIVEIFLPSDVTVNSYYKYTATSDNPTPHWYEFMYDGETGAIIEGDKITLHFQDGKRGDEIFDVEDQYIDDQGGPVLVATAVPLFGPFGYILLSSLFGFFALRRLRS